jgi:hypothetical protein
MRWVVDASIIRPLITRDRRLLSRLRRDPQLAGMAMDLIEL